MSINDTIRDLDDAREYYKRIKGMDKLGRRLILGSLATMAGSFATAAALDNGNATLMMIPALFALAVGIWFWVYANTSVGYYKHTDRLTDARRDVRSAEKAHEEATMGGAS